MKENLKAVGIKLSCLLLSLVLHLALVFFLWVRIQSTALQDYAPSASAIVKIWVLEGKKPLITTTQKITKVKRQSSAKVKEAEKLEISRQEAKRIVSEAPVTASSVSHIPADQNQGSVSSNAGEEGVYSLAESQEKLLLVGGYVEPTYPRRAILKRQEGLVLARLHLENGVIIREQLIQSSGYPLLDQAALSAFRQWRFRKISTQFVQQVRFKLQ